MDTQLTQLPSLKVGMQTYFYFLQKYRPCFFMGRHNVFSLRNFQLFKKQLRRPQDYTQRMRDARCCTFVGPYTPTVLTHDDTDVSAPDTIQMSRTFYGRDSRYKFIRRNLDVPLCQKLHCLRLNATNSVLAYSSRSVCVHNCAVAVNPFQIVLYDTSGAKLGVVTVKVSKCHQYAYFHLYQRCTPRFSRSDERRFLPDLDRLVLFVVNDAA